MNFQQENSLEALFETIKSSLSHATWYKSATPNKMVRTACIGAAKDLLPSGKLYTIWDNKISQEEKDLDAQWVYQLKLKLASIGAEFICTNTQYIDVGQEKDTDFVLKEQIQQRYLDGEKDAQIAQLLKCKDQQESAITIIREQFEEIKRLKKPDVRPTIYRCDTCNNIMDAHDWCCQKCHSKVQALAKEYLSDKTQANAKVEHYIQQLAHAQEKISSYENLVVTKDAIEQYARDRCFWDFSKHLLDYLAGKQKEAHEWAKERKISFEKK